MLYILGLSFQATAIVMEAFGVFLSKTSVYCAVQAAGEAIPGMKRTKMLSGYRTRAIGGDVTYVKCKGKWLPIGVVVDAINGMVLSIDHLSGEDAQTLQEWIGPIAEVVGAHTLVTDDADAFKQGLPGCSFQTAPNFYADTMKRCSGGKTTWTRCPCGVIIAGIGTRARMDLSFNVIWYSIYSPRNMQSVTTPGTAF